MENSQTTTSMMHNILILVRNLLCLLNVALWLSVFYFSTNEDKIAAVLSYLYVLLTVLLIKYGFRDVKINESFAFVVNTLSKIMILTGISLAFLSQYLNTAFYSVCLGIMLQRMKYEMELTSVIGSSSQSETGVAGNEREAQSLQFYNLVQKKKDDLRGLNKDRKHTNIIRRISRLVKGMGETINEVCSSDKTKKYLDIFEIPSFYKEKNITYNQKLQNFFSEGSNEIMLNAKNTKYIKDDFETILQYIKNVPKANSTNLEVERNLKEITSLCTFKAETLNLQELKLIECYKDFSDFKSDEIIDEKELKRNNGMNNTSEKLVLNDEMLKFSEDDIKQTDSVRNMTESQSDEEIYRILAAGFPQIQENICSSVCLDTEKSSSNSGKLNSLDEAINENELKRNKEMINTFENLIALDEEMLKLKDNVKQTDSIRSMTETQSEEEMYRTLKAGFPWNEVNICSNVGLDTEKSSSNSDKQNCFDLLNETKNEFNFESVYPIIDLNSLSRDISELDAVFQSKRNYERVNTYAANERTKRLLNKNDLQRDILVERNENLDKRNKHEAENCATENVNIQTEVTCDYLMKCIPELKIDENMKNVLEKKDPGLFLKSEDSASETSQNSCKSSLKDNEAVVNAEVINETKGLLKEACEEMDVSEVHLQVSNVEGVVNKIDLGFIYSI